MADGYGPEVVGETVSILMLVRFTELGDNGYLIFGGVTKSIYGEDLNLGIGGNLIDISAVDSMRFTGRMAIVTGKIFCGPGLPAPVGIRRGSFGDGPEWIILDARIDWP